MSLPQKTKNTLIIGIGNEFRKDDAVGLHTARQLKELFSGNIDIVEMSGEGAELLEHWNSYETVFIIDAVRTKNNPGTIFRFDSHTDNLPVSFFNYSSHAFGLAEAVEVGRKLSRLPSQLFIYGIAGENFSLGTGLSKEAEDAAKVVVRKIQEEIKKQFSLNIK